jgi:hypothetical protein
MAATMHPGLRRAVRKYVVHRLDSASNWRSRPFDGLPVKKRRSRPIGLIVMIIGIFKIVDGAAIQDLDQD